eukprot:CAMPEP_0179438848 /NCGR_PEP_ID=MMETSP0799-20121207/22527_1 /TAXON_ID=46947 /ORGANISM="Geminigera cryophila, Strain CCMP2564" /LENGTH=105 /DNA_ID=CAMNT_0021220767 /DNA_START=266 /DNA_END=583 /DNA_ORIENTATION=+
MAKAYEKIGQTAKARANYQAAGAVFSMRLGDTNLQAQEAIFRANQLAIAPYENLRNVQTGFFEDEDEWDDQDEEWGDEDEEGRVSMGGDNYSDLREQAALNDERV